MKLADQLRVALGFFERIEILALQIFDQRQLQHGAIIRLTDDHRHLAQTQKLRRAPASFTGDEFELLAFLADKQRLNDASLPDRVGEFAQCFWRKILARLQRTRTNPVQRHLTHMVAWRATGCGRRRGRRRGRWGRKRRGRRWFGNDGSATQQRAKTATQSWLSHASRVSQGGRVVNFSPPSGEVGRQNPEEDQCDRSGFSS